jgi:hypothetical protein
MPVQSRQLTRLLDDLEERIDPDQETQLVASWLNFSNGTHQGDFFHPQRARKRHSSFDWEPVTVNAALDDFETMAIQQFGACSLLLEKGSGDLLNVRCNYGTGILPSLFGLEIFIMDEETNTLPTSRPLNTIEEVERLLDQGVPDLANGYGAKVFQMAELFAEIVSRYPKIKQFISVYHPDLQGPMDVCELVFGSSLFYALYDHPGLVTALLELVCETYTHFMKAWIEIHPFGKLGNAHWGMFHRGNIMLRDDSAMNLSPAMVREFVLPYDQRLLDTFNGGAVHFCGKGDHFIEAIGSLQGLYAVNLTQPELNDMEIIYQNTIDQGIALLALKRQAAQEALDCGRNLHHLVHVIE